MSDQPNRHFEVKSAPKAGMIGRLFGRVPRETAFVEVRNILAKTPFEEVRESDIAGALAKAKLLCRGATKELTVIFEHAALLAAADRELSDRDRRGLAALQLAFELTDAEAASAVESAVGQVFERTMREALSDGIHRAREGEPRSHVKGARHERRPDEAVIRDGRYRRGAAADRRYAKDEEAHVTALAKSLGVTIKHDESTVALVARFKLMAKIEDGDLPSLAVPILLKRGELCHFAGPADHYQLKTVTKRMNYGGPTASIKIMKGVRWRVG